MKILHVLNHSVPHTDGYCVRSAAIVAAQKELGLEPIVVTSPHQEPVPTQPVETIDGIRYYRILPGGETSLPVLHEIQAMRRLRRRIEEIVRQERPNVIHAHSPSLWGRAALSAARCCGIPFVYEVRGLWEEGAVDQGRLRVGSPKYRISRALETHVTCKADAVVTISSGLVGEFESRGVEPSKLYLVPNGVDVSEFSIVNPDGRLKDSLGLSGCVVVGYIGSLYRWEGIDDLVRAVPHVLEQNKAARVLIIGRGESEPELRELIERLSLQKQVLLIGHVPHRDIRRYYSLLDVLVYPRRRTRQMELVTPLKPLEAMAMGKAVVGSDVGGIRELLQDRGGLLFRAEDSVDLSMKLADLLCDAEHRRAIGSTARKYVIETRNWNVLAKTYLDVYRKLLCENGVSDEPRLPLSESSSSELLPAVSGD